MKYRKYRGKTIVGKKWVYGCYVYLNKKSYIVTEDDKYHEINSITLGQYTGEDIGDIEVYEDDLVAIFYKKALGGFDSGNVESYKDVKVINKNGYMLGQIVFEHGAFLVPLNGNPLMVNEWYREDLPVGMWINEEENMVELLGNIHDNDEYL